MDAKELPPIDLLRKLLRYEPETGLLFWREREPVMFAGEGMAQAANCNRWNARLAGKMAGRLSADGYTVVSIFDWPYQAHRLIWCIYYGQQLKNKECIDHINHAKSDNRICNLRLCDKQANMKNQSLPSNNTSGVMGVNFHSGSGKWEARICINYKRISLGRFDRIDDAIAARKKAKDNFGFHENHGQALS